METGDHLVSIFFVLKLSYYGLAEYFISTSKKLISHECTNIITLKMKKNSCIRGKNFQAFKTSSFYPLISISFKNFAHFKKIVTFVATLGVSVDKTG